MVPLRLKFLLVAFSACFSTAALSEVYLHAFNWPYREIAARADEIADIGYDAVLVMPPVKSEGGFWWARYQPQDYRVVDNPLGNKNDLKAAIDALANRGVKLIADVVLTTWQMKVVREVTSTTQVAVSYRFTTMIVLRKPISSLVI